ncbi:MAG: hypothetical protein V1703_02190, partial [Candidatus Altiarchaeota archaeon]
IPLILALAAFFSRKNTPLVLTLLVFTAMSMSIDLWALMQNLPFLYSLRLPCRLILMVVFILSLFSGFTTSKIEKKSKVFLLLVLIVIVLDFTHVNKQVLGEAFPVPYFYDNPIKRDFMQVNATLIGFDRYSEMLAELNRNNGVVNCYCPGHIPSMVTEAQSPAYRGEVYTASGVGAARVMEFTPNRVKVYVNVTSADSVVLNQNYYPGWHVSTGGVVESYRGLLSTKTSPETHEIEFYYLPSSFIIGAFITLSASFTLLILLVKYLKSR